MSAQQLAPPPVTTIDDIIIQAIRWGKIEGRSIRIDARDKEKVVHIDLNDNKWAETIVNELKRR